jgi:hypothetical protein
MVANQYPAEFIVNAEKVCSIFGKWPTFHNAEVLSLAFDRGTPPNPRPSMLIRVWTYEVHHDEIDLKGFYRLTDHSIVTFRFDEPEDLVIEDFNHQNVLFNINFNLTDNMVHVTFESTYGVHATFRCQKVSVVAVEAA